MNQNSIKAMCDKLGRPTEAEGGAATAKCEVCADLACLPEICPYRRPGSCECPGHDDKDETPNDCTYGPCPNDAVRVVTVREPGTVLGVAKDFWGKPRNLCGPCSEYHERGGR